MGRDPADPAARPGAHAGFAVGQLLPVLGTTVEAVRGRVVPYLNAALAAQLPLPARRGLRDGPLRPLRPARGDPDGDDLRGRHRPRGARLCRGHHADRTSPSRRSAWAGPALLRGRRRARGGAVPEPGLRSAPRAWSTALFFRERRDIQAVPRERCPTSMTTLLDLDAHRAAHHRARWTICSTRRRPRAAAPRRGPERYRPMRRGRAPRCAGAAPPTVRSRRLLGRRPFPSRGSGSRRIPSSRRCASRRSPAWTRSGATLVVPISSGGASRACSRWGRKRAGTAYTTEDLRSLRLLANQSAVALENARAYTALQVANTELAVRASPRADPGVDPGQPRQVRSAHRAGAHRGGAGGARVREARGGRLRALRGHRRATRGSASASTSARVNELVERYFGAFLDEILREGATSTRRRATGSW